MQGFHSMPPLSTTCASMCVFPSYLSLTRLCPWLSHPPYLLSLFVPMSVLTPVPVSSPYVLVCIFPVLFWQSLLLCLVLLHLCYYVNSFQLCSPCVPTSLVISLYIYCVSVPLFFVRQSVHHAPVIMFCVLCVQCIIWFSLASPSLVIVQLPPIFFFTVHCSLSKTPSLLVSRLVLYLHLGPHPAPAFQP